MCYHLCKKEEEIKNILFICISTYIPRISLEDYKNKRQELVASGKENQVSRRMEWGLFNVSSWTF